MPVTRRDFLVGSSLAATAAGLAGTAWPGTAWAGVAPPAPKPAPAFRPESWASVRAQFRLSPDYAHLSNFYIVSHPKPVRDAIDRYRRALDDNPALFLESHMFERDEDKLCPKVSAAAAEYIGGSPAEIALTGSTTMGLALVYNGLRLEPGQEILTTTHDHFSHHESIRLAAGKWGAPVRKVALFDDSASIAVEPIVSRLRAAVRDNTRIIGLTWVHSNTGVKLPVRPIAEALAEINRNRDPDDRALLVLDGVHGFGAAQEQAAQLGADFFVAGTHKWIFAPRGTGLIWARPESWAHVQPTVPSFIGLEPFQSWKEEQPPEGPTRATWVSPGGFVAYEHQWAAVEAFQFHRQIGRKRVADRITALNSRIKEGLAAMRHVTLHTPLDPALSAGINCFEVRGYTPQQVVARLLERRIVASYSPYKVTYARLSAGIMNTPEEVERALMAVRALA